MRKRLRSTILFCALFSCVAVANSTPNLPVSSISPEYDSAQPPLGFVDFCARNREECQSSGEKAGPIMLTERNWATIRQINKYINNRVEPISDQELYGLIDYWTYPTDKGDCEDYVLMKKRYLQNLGLPASAMLITVVLDEKNEGHAVLTLETSRGEFILDNRRDEIVSPKQSAYRYVKRQSAHNASKWVMLTAKKPLAHGTVSGLPARN